MFQINIESLSNGFVVSTSDYTLGKHYCSTTSEAVLTAKEFVDQWEQEAKA